MKLERNHNCPIPCRSTYKRISDFNKISWQSYYKMEKGVNTDSDVTTSVIKEHIISKNNKNSDVVRTVNDFIAHLILFSC